MFQQNNYFFGYWNNWKCCSLNRAFLAAFYVSHTYKFRCKKCSQKGSNHRFIWTEIPLCLPWICKLRIETESTGLKDLHENLIVFWNIMDERGAHFKCVKLRIKFAINLQFSMRANWLLVMQIEITKWSKSLFVTKCRDEKCKSWFLKVILDVAQCVIFYIIYVLLCILTRWIGTCTF